MCCYTPGGRALKFYSSVRIEVRKIETLKSGTEIIGARTRAKVVKNKIAPPFREAEFDIMYGTGISREGELLDLAVKLDIVKKSGAWFSYKDEKLGQGRDKVKELFHENEKIANEIEEKVNVNVDKLYGKANLKAAARAVATPVEVPVIQESENDVKANIDITVDD